MKKSKVAVPSPDHLATMVSSKHVVGYQSASLSTDGTSAMIVFEVAGMEGAPAERFALTLPVELCSVFRLIGFHLELQAVQRGKAVKTLLSSINPEGKEDVVVAEVPNDPNVLCLAMNPRGSEEMTFKLTNVTAMKLSAIMRIAVWSKLTKDEIAEVEMVEKQFMAGRVANEDAQRVG